MVTVEPINAFPVIPNPPLTINEPVRVEDELKFPPTDSPVPVNCKFAFSLIAVEDVA